VSKLVSVVRLAAVLLGCVAVLATVADTATRATINPFNFFGFFTMQSNIIWYVVVAVTAVVVLTGRQQSALLQLARGCATAYMILVGAIYNALLAGQEGGVALAWANSVVHVVLPLYAVLDWLVFNDRRPLVWKRLWVSLIYPVVWVVVVLIRGATDGWVPYPFLDPDTGYGLVFAYVGGIAALTVVTAAVVWALSRLQLGEADQPAAETARRSQTTARCDRGRGDGAA
jgi:hypothetical protein